MRTKRFFLLLAGCLALDLSTQSCVDDDGGHTIIIPEAGSATECTANDGDGDHSESFGPAQTIQTYYPAGQLNGLKIGSVITGLAIRADSSMTNAWPTVQNGGFSIFKIKIGKGKNTFTKEDSFALNFDETEDPAVEVRGGADDPTKTFDAGTFTVDGSPNDFGPVIPFFRTFTYKGGPLIIEIRTSMPSSGEPTLKADKCGTADGSIAKNLSTLSTDGTAADAVPANSALVFKLSIL